MLLEQLKDVRKNDRGAKFVTAAVLYINHKKVFVEFGEIKGMLTTKQKGNKGFGYDPIFVPEGYKKTIAEMRNAQKNQISHRKMAMEKIAKYVKKL